MAISTDLSPSAFSSSLHIMDAFALYGYGRISLMCVKVKSKKHINLCAWLFRVVGICWVLYWRFSWRHKNTSVNKYKSIKHIFCLPASWHKWKTYKRCPWVWWRCRGEREQAWRLLAAGQGVRRWMRALWQDESPLQSRNQTPGWHFLQQETSKTQGVRINLEGMQNSQSEKRLWG